MGATEFMTLVSGDSAREAFRSATEEARYMHGHGGYSGTIAEKRSFQVIHLPGHPSYPTPEEAFAYAEKLLAEGDARVDDKWGPAGCIRVVGNQWLFFGFASS